MNYVEINTDAVEVPKVGESLIDNRNALAKTGREGMPKVTIIIQAYNRIEKLKRCVESVLTYTKNIEYELLLLDNGSSEEVLDYFKAVPFERKRIVRITKNLRSSFPSTTLNLCDFGEFIVHLNDDLIVTKCWLDNLLACIESDPRIGVVVPTTNNSSNFQSVDFPYHSYEEMQQKASEFNHSDPRKWEDRLRLITLSAIYRKAMLIGTGWPILDGGFFHDFGDDDIAFTVRRLGYRTVLAGDTWICHDHDYRHGEDKDPEEFRRSLSVGRQNFRDKYFGIDAWDDVNNFLRVYAQRIPLSSEKRKHRVLGIDVRCGTPILDVKNMLRKVDVFDTELSAFTQDAKYWLDLKTICEGNVVCDREEFLSDSFPKEYFDYIVADRPINRYHEPQKLLRDMFSLCKSNGYVICKLHNTASFQTFANMLGEFDVYDSEFSYNISLEVAGMELSRFGNVVNIVGIPYGGATERKDALQELLPAEFSDKQKQELSERLLFREYLIVVQKK